MYEQQCYVSAGRNEFLPPAGRNGRNGRNARSLRLQEILQNRMCFRNLHKISDILTPNTAWFGESQNLVSRLGDVEKLMFQNHALFGVKMSEILCRFWKHILFCNSSWNREDFSFLPFLPLIRPISAEFLPAETANLPAGRNGSVTLGMLKYPECNLTII